MMISQSLRALEGQLAQAQRDVEALRELKQEALADPQAFVRLLESPGRCAGCFPRLQRIETVPMVDVSRYQRRFTRHISHKYDQNLGMARDAIDGRLDGMVLMECGRVSGEAGGRVAADAPGRAPGVGGTGHPRKPRVGARGDDRGSDKRPHVENAGGMATQDTDAGGGNVALGIGAGGADNDTNGDGHS